MSIATDLQVPTQVQVQDGVFKGKWGYYPCDRQTFLEIKELHRYALHHLRAERRWLRWDAKLPKNRKGKEPEFSGGMSNGDFYELVLEQYRIARYPALCQESVRKLSLPRKWRSRLDGLRNFYGDIKK